MNTQPPSDGAVAPETLFASHPERTTPNIEPAWTMVATGDLHSTSTPTSNQYIVLYTILQAPVRSI